jgi:4-amino-4-deoxy-L-arabinose transferase-like glycosyltransferase
MSKSERKLVLVLLCVCLTLLFFRLGSRPLWNVDEGMHAVTSKEMVLTGDWITTTYNGEKFYDKPILYNWFAAIAFLLFGFTEFAARLPAALLGFGCVVLTYLLGRKMFGPTTGFLGGMILTTSGMFIALSRFVVQDIALVFFMTLALYFFYLGYTSEPHRKTWFLLFYASLGFAVLAKGPLGVLLPGMIIGLLLLLKGRLSFLKEMEMGWGVLIFLIVAAPWYVLISLNNSDYAGYFFIENNIMRFLSPNALHAGPFYFYLPLLIGGFSPWSFFLPLAFIHVFRGGWRGMNDGTLFVVLWISVIFLFFSVASSKGNAYLLPLFPAASLLVAILWRDFIETPSLGLRKGFIYSFLPLILPLVVGLVYLLVNPPTMVEEKYGVDLMKMTLLGFIIMATQAFAFIALLKRHYRVSFGFTSGLMIAASLVFTVWVAPLINPFKSTIRLAQKYDTLAAPGGKMVFFGRIKDSALFYSDRKAVRIVDNGKLIEYLRSNPKALVIMHKRDLERVELLKRISYVIDSEGNHLLVAPRK